MTTGVGAFTVTKENVEDDRALLNTGVIGTGTEVNIIQEVKDSSFVPTFTSLAVTG